jgi:hypothetical protein
MAPATLRHSEAKPKNLAISKNQVAHKEILRMLRMTGWVLRMTGGALHQSVADGDRHGFGSGVRVELDEDVGDV